MLQGHVFHSFSKPHLRSESPYVLSQFIGGMPPAIFLFLTGVTLAFLMDSYERKGFDNKTRILSTLRRSGYLFALAYAFRLQMFLVGWPGTRWSDVFKVDILNCMGFAIAVMSLMSIFSTTDRARLCAILGLITALLSPLVSALNWTGVPNFIRMYLEPNPNFFGFFPWAPFLIFGVSVGSIIRLVKPEDTERLMQWAAIGGFGLIFSAQYAANLPYSLYPSSDFWLNGPTLILMKLGILLVMMAFAWVWHTNVVKDRWSWVSQLGTTSLLIYWVHTEMVYGRWFWFWKDNLTTGPIVIYAVCLILSMIGLSTWWTRWWTRRRTLTSATAPLASPPPTA